MGTFNQRTTATAKRAIFTAKNAPAIENCARNGFGCQEQTIAKFSKYVASTTRFIEYECFSQYTKKKKMGEYAQHTYTKQMDA